MRTIENFHPKVKKKNSNKIRSRHQWKQLLSFSLKHLLPVSEFEFCRWTGSELKNKHGKSRGFSPCWTKTKLRLATRLKVLFAFLEHVRVRPTFATAAHLADDKSRGSELNGKRELIEKPKRERKIKERKFEMSDTQQIHESTEKSNGFSDKSRRPRRSRTETHDFSCREWMHLSKWRQFGTWKDHVRSVEWKSWGFNMCELLWQLPLPPTTI